MLTNNVEQRSFRAELRPAILTLVCQPIYSRSYRLVRISAPSQASVVPYLDRFLYTRKEHSLLFKMKFSNLVLIAAAASTAVAAPAKEQKKRASVFQCWSPDW